MQQVVKDDLNRMVKTLNRLRPMDDGEFALDCSDGYKLVKLYTGSGKSDVTDRHTALVLFEIMYSIENFLKA